MFFFFVARKYDALSNVRWLLVSQGSGTDPWQTATCFKSFRGWKSVSWDSYNEGLLTDQLKKPTQISINWKIIETHSSPRGQTNVKWNGIRTKQSNNKNNKPHFLFIKLEGWLPKMSKTKNGEEQKQAFYVQRWKANLKELEKETKKKQQQTIAPLPLNRCVKYCNPLKCICFLRVIKANKFNFLCQTSFVLDSLALFHFWFIAHNSTKKISLRKVLGLMYS